MTGQKMGTSADGTPLPRLLSRWVGVWLGLLGALLCTPLGNAEELPPPVASPELSLARPEGEAPMPRREAPPANPAQAAPGLTLADALRWGLEHNPQLALARMQRGIAQAGVVIANTYPFNPIFQHFVWGASGPPAAGVTNHVFNEHTTRLDLELRGQGRHRQAMAKAALSRVEWEIASQEVLTAIQIVRAFDTALYRREKLGIQEELLHLQEDVLRKVEPLVEQGHLSRSELMLARADLVDAQTALRPSYNQFVVAWNDLARVLGIVDENCPLKGTLEWNAPPLCEDEVVKEADQRRPDLHALEVAVKEADAALRLQIANRYGNPSIGPAFEENETSVSFVGMWLIWSPPVLNTRRGEIMQRQADVARATQAIRSMELTIRQDVAAALRRLNSAREMADTLRTKTLPELENLREGFDQMFARGEPGVTLARVIAIRTRLIQTRGTYLDALFELSQARADLAAAVGDPSLALPVVAPVSAPVAAAPEPK